MHELMVWTWAGWEPLQYYRRLGGFHEAQEGNAHWAEDWSALLHSERTAEALAAAGITWVTTHFFKGFGLAIEAEEIADTARMIENFHKHAVRVFTYIQYGTTVPETLVDEEPSAAQWGRTDWNDRHDGHPYEYGEQYWRDKPCANQPGFRAYMLRCVEQAIAIGADGIWIDNLQSDGCHCPACQEAFQLYLQAHVQDPWQELGVRNLARVTIPRAHRPCDPVYQAWLRFRCAETAESARLLTARARALKPDILVAANIGIDAGHQRPIPGNGNWFSDLAVFDLTYAENRQLPGWHGDHISSQHFSAKIAETLGIHIVPGAGVGERSRLYPRPAVPDQALLRRLFAESALFGGHPAGGPWGLRGENAGAEMRLLRDTDYQQRNRRLAELYGEWHSLFAESTDAAPVGLLYSFEATAFDDARSIPVIQAMAQLLREHQVPFRYVLSDRLEKLEGLKTLVLPHVLPMSNALAERIRTFVADGGVVLATGRTSLYDEAMRQRRDYALADVFGAHFSNAFEDTGHDAIHINPANECILLPGEWGLTQGDGTPACRVAGERIVQVLRRAIPTAALPEVLAPLPHVGAEVRRLSDGRRLLGLINYAHAPVRGIEIAFDAQEHTPASVRAFSTDVPKGLHLPCRRLVDGRIGVTVPELAVELYIELDALTPA